MRSGDSRPGFGASGNADLSLPSSILNTIWIPGITTQGSGEHKMDPQKLSEGSSDYKMDSGHIYCSNYPRRVRRVHSNEFIRSFVLLLTATSLARESSSWLSRFDMRTSSNSCDGNTQEDDEETVQTETYVKRRK